MHDLFLVLEDQGFTLRFNIVNFGTGSIALVIGGVLGNALIAIGLFSLFGTIVYGYVCWVILIRSNTDLHRIKKGIIETVIRTLPAIFLVLVLKFLNFESIIIVVVTSALILLYMVFLAKRDTQIRMLIVNFRSSRNQALA